MEKRRYIKQKIIQLFDRAEIMKKILKWFGVAAVYIGVALVVILIMQYFYLSSDFFRSLFEGGTLQAAPAAEGAAGTASGTASNLTETTAKLSFYILIFVMLLRCDFRKLGKLGPRMICIFMGCAITLGIGFFALFPLFANALGGADKTWGATAALYASWVGGSANMAAMEDALPVDSGAYSCALALDTACYSLWIALLLFAVKYAQKWNKACKADTSKLDAVAAAANEEVAKETNVKPNAADWIFLIGLTLVVSAISQYIGVQMNGFFKGVGLSFFDKGTCTTVFVTILGLICAMTPLGKLPAVTELSSVYLYAVVSLIASTATLIDLLSAPMWVVYGLGILLVHVVLMFILSKIFHWDLCMDSTASVACIGGSASAPIIATAYDGSFAGIGVLMGVLGAAIGNFMGLGMGALLKLFV